MITIDPSDSKPNLGICPQHPYNIILDGFHIWNYGITDHTPLANWERSLLCDYCATSPHS